MVSEHLVEISGTEAMMWFWKIYYMMVRTRQGAMTNSSPIRRREYDSLDGNEAKGDPLVDTASHLLVVSAHSERGESGGIRMTLHPVGQNSCCSKKQVAID